MKKFLPLLLCLVLLNSCHKSERDNDIDSSTGEDVCRIASFEADVLEQMHTICDTLPQVNKIMAGCMNVSVSGSTYPKTVTIDYGNVNCTGSDGASRRGIISVIFTGKYKDSLSVITISTSNYYLNDNKVDLTRTITNKGTDTTGNLWFTETETLNVTLTNQKTISYNANYSRKWTSGQSTSGNFSDDVFTITSGSSTGTGSRGNTFTAEITNTISLSGSCRWPVSGTIKLSPANQNIRTIDFGSGSCDANSTVDIGGNTVNITMP
jgi:hypothetical protein